MITSIYRSARNEGMYLYVDKRDGLSKVPEPLMKRFGVAELAMTLLITPEKKLARADTAKVLAGIEEQGFYLQMPPTVFSEMAKMSDQNSKMAR
ncbi:MAG: YcgL domain-containing protein [Pseudomonadales bacterium]